MEPPKTTKSFVLAYACRKNYGSDREVGYSFCKRNDNFIERIYVSKEDFTGNFKEHLLNVDKYLSIIPRRWRFYLAHLEFQFKAFSDPTRKFIIVSFTQVLTPILYGGSNILYGPMGTTLPYTQGFLSKFIRTRIYWRILRWNYKFIVPKHAKVSFVHPYLQQELGFPKAPVFTALDFSYIKSVDVECKREIDLLAVVRNISFKRLKLIRSMFTNLAAKGFSCVIINGDKATDNLENGYLELGRRNRADVLQKFSSSKLHFFPSYELAGFVVGEAIMSGCPSVCYENNGGHFLLNPSPDFLFDDSNIYSVVEHLLNNQELIDREAELQRANFIRNIDVMMTKKEDFYDL